MHGMPEQGDPSVRSLPMGLACCPGRIMGALQVTDNTMVLARFNIMPIMHTSRDAVVAAVDVGCTPRPLRAGPRGPAPVTTPIRTAKKISISGGLATYPSLGRLSAVGWVCCPHSKNFLVNTGV